MEENVTIKAGPDLKEIIKGWYEIRSYKKGKLQSVEITNSLEVFVAHNNACRLLKTLYH